MEAQEKADLFASTFQAKCKLTAVERNEFSCLADLLEESEFELGVLQLEDSKSILGKLEEDSATGPDMLPTKILKRMANVLALPFLLLAQCIISTGRWPEP